MGEIKQRYVQAPAEHRHSKHSNQAHAFSEKSRPRRCLLSQPVNHCLCLLCLCLLCKAQILQNKAANCQAWIQMPWSKFRLSETPAEPTRAVRFSSRLRGACKRRQHFRVVLQNALQTFCRNKTVVRFLLAHLAQARLLG